MTHFVAPSSDLPRLTLPCHCFAHVQLSLFKDDLVYQYNSILGENLVNGLETLRMSQSSGQEEPEVSLHPLTLLKGRGIEIRQIRRRA